MKVEVIVKFPEEVTSKCEVSLTSSDLVRDVKSKLAAAKLIAFPRQSLVYNGKTLADNESLGQNGVKENSTLEFVIHATEATVTEQLAELLSGRDLSADELGLLYCYKYGVSINHALASVGYQGSLADFVRESPNFTDSDKVSYVRSATLKPFSVVEEVEKMLENGPMEVPSLARNFASQFKVTLSDLTNKRTADFLAAEKKFALLGDGRVALASQAKSPPWVKSKAALFGEALGTRGVKARAVEKVRPCISLDEPGRSDQMYQDLHAKISSRAFNSRVAQCLMTVVDAVQGALCLSVHSVAKGGSVGTGTALESCQDASVTLFVQGLPTVGHQVWLPRMLRMAGALLEQEDSFRTVSCADDAVRFVFRGMPISLTFSPVFDSYTDTVQALGNQGPHMRRYFATAFAKEQAHFIAKQPGSVKVTIRLLKWWRDQQEWSCDLTRPSDTILHLVCIYASQQKPQDQEKAVANVMALLARFDELRILWTNYYVKSDIWAPLLLQKPLLMDPLNPFVNVADPQVFDPRELMEKASSTHFFW